MIVLENGKKRYYDKHGVEITNGCEIRHVDGTVGTVCLTSEGELGTDATNPSWIKSGRAMPCEFGIYPLGHNETNEVEVVTD